MGIYNSVQIEFLKTELLEVKDNVKRNTIIDIFTALKNQLFCKANVTLAML